MNKVYTLVVDAISYVMPIYMWFFMQFSIMFTINLDCLCYSNKPITINNNKYIGSYTIRSNNHFNQKVVAWFYRWHDIPDITDWENCLNRFKIKQCPHYFIILDSNESIEIVDIDKNFYRYIHKKEKNIRYGCGSTKYGGLSVSAILKNINSS